MIFGALVAASNDLSFDARGYVFIILNDVTTALQGVYTKKKLEAKEIGKYGLLFYNALFNLLPFYALCEWTGRFLLTWLSQIMVQSTAKLLQKKNIQWVLC